MTPTAAHESVMPFFGTDAMRRRSILAFSLLLAISLGFDYSVYVGGLGHGYVHEVATAAVAVIAVIVARRRGSAIPSRRGIVLLFGLLGLLVLNTVVIGALHYSSVPAAMHKLFWLEHGNALRILFELAVWVWAFGLIDPDQGELRSILAAALWGGAVAIVLDAGFWLLNDQVHLATTTFDLTVMFGLPLAALFLLRQGNSRANAVRVGIYGGACLLLYSRAALVVVIVTMTFVLISAGGRHGLRVLAPSILAGWATVLALTLVIGFLSPLPGTSHLPAPPGVSGTTQKGNSVTGMLLRLLSIGDQQIAGYTVPGRRAIWRDALSIAKRSPVIGVGYHDYFMYSSVSEIKPGESLNQGDLFGPLIKAAHNDFLSMLAETGAIGLLIYIGFWLLLLAGAMRLWWRKEPDRPTAGFWLGFFLSFAAVSLTGEFLIPRSPIWQAPAIMWWLLISTLLIEVDGRYGWLTWPRR